MTNDSRAEEYLELPYTHVLHQDADGDWNAAIDELEGCATHGATQAEALERLHVMQRLWIEDALESGQPIPKPRQDDESWSGKWLQRVPPSLHRLIARVAKLEGVSLNYWVSVVLAREVGHSLASQRAASQPFHDPWSRIEAFAVDAEMNVPPLPAHVERVLVLGDLRWDNDDAKAITHSTRR